MIELVVTRHPGLLDYLLEIGIATKNTIVISHATAETVIGKKVCGVLPHSLSCLCLSFTEIPLDLPLELRGKELTLEDMKKYASVPITYKVSVIATETTEQRPDKLFLSNIARREYNNHGQTNQPVIKIAASHNHALTPEECKIAGITPDTSCLKLTGGYNRKRPIYLLDGIFGLIVAEGTHMGNHSSFSLGKPGELRKVPRTIEEETRLNFLEGEQLE
ncbi:MAG: CRISPR-associated protein Csx16 [bacterium]